MDKKDFDKVYEFVGKIASELNIHIGSPEEILLHNRGGYVYAKAMGFTYSYRTSSYADGPDTDLSDILLRWIKGLGFRIENSYGDNGMDSSTNFRDTWWNYDFIYEPTLTYDIESHEEEDEEEV